METGRRRKTDRDTASVETQRVLIVDDDGPYLRYVALVLRRAGLEVETATSGAAAIEAVEKNAGFRLLLIDYEMPMMNGIETVRRLHEVAGDTSIYTILLTAHSGSEMKLRAFENGFDDFLSKTEPEPAIVAKVRSAVRRLEMERQLHIENEQLQRLAYTDELTGAANRRALRDAADALVSEKKSFGVVLLDIDRFKHINDTYGHALGDRVLADVATCLKACTRVGDVIARYGGDEFVLLLPGTSAEETQSFAARVAEAIAALEWKIGAEAVHVSASFGCASGGANLLEPLQDCDLRLYEQKRRERGAHSRSISRPEPRPAITGLLT